MRQQKKRLDHYAKKIFSKHVKNTRNKRIKVQGLIKSCVTLLFCFIRSYKVKYGTRTVMQCVTD